MSELAPHLVQQIADIVCGAVDSAVDLAIRTERRRLTDLVAWCEDCDTPMRNDEYYSAQDCNKTGKGVVLCLPCCTLRDRFQIKKA